MAIEKLEDATVRTIGASQVLADPATVVKELIDNALDAHATSIAIEVHNNTLDVIQVRDNGHGIAPEDRAMVARPNCTSKLVGIDDLKTLAGSSLGFRGQALASAAEMSGSLTISTRVEGEMVATALRINQRGEVVGQDRASLPVGTTVRITDFIKANPVRRQVALKSTEKCLKKLKETLQAYAFARSQVRYSLRVLKAKNEKCNWTYAPKPGGTLEDAALKIVGSGCVSLCTWTVLDQRDFTLQALVPKPDAEAAKISNIGSFFSIDGRPVSSARGTVKQVLKIFRESLKGASPAFDGVKEPFIHMQIICPLASYDPNVEPAKDDVLFEDPDIVIELARKLFSSVYAANDEPAKAHVQAVSNRQPDSLPMQVDDLDNDFATALEGQMTRIPAKIASAETQVERLHTPSRNSDVREGDSDEIIVGPRRTFRSNMYGCDEEDVDSIDARPQTGRTEAEFEELRQARKDVTVSNPWVMAKMHASVQRPLGATERSADSFEGSRSPTVRVKPHEMLEDVGLPTPRPSSPSPPNEQFHPSDHVPDMRIARDGRAIGPPSLPPSQIYAPLGSSPPRLNLESSVLDVEKLLPRPEPPPYNHGQTASPTGASKGTPLDAIPEGRLRARASPQKRPQGQLNRPFVSPVVQQSPQEQVWFDHLERRRKVPKPYQQEVSNPLVRQGELGDLLDDSRPLTPPRRNRDIRDFVDSADLAGAETDFEQANRSVLVDQHTGRPSKPSGENPSPRKNALGIRGFMPASELAAFEARVGQLDEETPKAPPPKRRKTGQGVLREISANAKIQSNTHHDIEGTKPTKDANGARPSNNDDEEYLPVADLRASSRRRRTTEGDAGKVHRTKSSRLPLERVPAGQGMHGITLTIQTSGRDVSRKAGAIDEEMSLIGWNEPAVDAYGAFTVPSSDAELQALSARLRELLVNKVSDGEMVQDVDVLMRDAFAAHARVITESQMYGDESSEL